MLYPSASSALKSSTYSCIWNSVRFKATGWENFWLQGKLIGTNFLHPFVCIFSLLKEVNDFINFRQPETLEYELDHYNGLQIFWIAYLKLCAFTVIHWSCEVKDSSPACSWSTDKKAAGVKGHFKWWLLVRVSRKGFAPNGTVHARLAADD